MELLSWPNTFKLAGLVCLFASQVSWANPYDPPPAIKRAMEAAQEQLCNSTEEYIKALKFLRESKEITFREDAARKIADQVANGCNGAADRFAQVLLLLKAIGISERRCLEMALEFSTFTPEVQKNFVEIFSRSFLAEFFDYEYGKAMRLAYDLSKNYKGDPVQAREDFIELVRFCKDSKKLDLPVNFCAEYVVKIAGLSQYYLTGVRTPFYTLLTELRQKKELSLDLKTSLEMIYHILKNGPTAPKNFYDAFNFATSESGLGMDKKTALNFAVSLAYRSHVGDEPPIMYFPFSVNAVP